LTIDKPSEIDVELDIQENQATGQIILKSPIDKIYTGEITFNQGDYQKNVPYRIVKTPNLDMNFEENYYVVEPRSVLSFPISKSDSELVCDFTFDRIFEPREDVSVTNQRSLVFRYNIEPGNYLVQAIYECESELGTLQGDYYFNIMHYPVLPFDIIKDFSIIDEEPGRVIIRNNIPEEITVDLRFETPVNDYNIDSPLTIPARQEAHTFIYQEVSSPLNIDEPNTLIGTSLGYEQRMDFEIRLDDNFHQQPATTFTDIQYIDTPILIIILIGMSAIIGVIVLYIVQNKKEKEKQERKSQSEEKKAVAKKEPEKNNKELGEVLVAVDKMMGEKDEEIESELKEQGYEIDEIKKMLKELEEVRSK
jgi:hypothetical protein